jgi:hypothetical protein
LNTIECTDTFETTNYDAAKQFNMYPQVKLLHTAAVVPLELPLHAAKALQRQNVQYTNVSTITVHVSRFTKCIQQNQPSAISGVMQAVDSTKAAIGSSAACIISPWRRRYAFPGLICQCRHVKRCRDLTRRKGLLNGIEVGGIQGQEEDHDA